MNDATMAAVLSAQDQGTKNYKQYSADRLASCVVPITDTIKKNNLHILGSTQKEAQSKSQTPYPP